MPGSSSAQSGTNTPELDKMSGNQDHSQNLKAPVAAGTGSPGNPGFHSTRVKWSAPGRRGVLPERSLLPPGGFALPLKPGAAPAQK